MGYVLNVNYREHVEEFLTSFIDACEKCDDTWEMRQSAKHLLGELEQYTQKH